MHPALTLAYQVQNVANPPIYQSTELEKREAEKWRELRKLGMTELSLRILMLMEPGEGYTRQDVENALSISGSSVKATFRLFFDKLGYTKMNYTPGPLGRMIPIHWLTPVGLSAKEYFNDLCND